MTALLGVEEPGMIVIVDGQFDQTLSVGHAEIREALRRGWEIWGVSSMGAIRAFEMRFLGMRGYGLVYEHFLAEEDYQDDEVAVLQSPTYPHDALSEPMVHLRYFVESLEQSGKVSHLDAVATIDELKSCWYGDRTLYRLTSI